MFFVLCNIEIDIIILARQLLGIDDSNLRNSQC